MQPSSETMSQKKPSVKVFPKHLSQGGALEVTYPQTLVESRRTWQVEAAWEDMTTEKHIRGETEEIQRKATILFKRTK